MAECPNSCSGHGECESYDQCNCQLEGVVINPKGNQFKRATEYGQSITKQAAWTGADCSLMKCPRGISWVEAAMDDTVDNNGVTNSESNKFCEHKLSVECSDKGLCDRTTGQCTCFPGYTGAACQRTQCPNDCSGHGICQSNIKFAQDATIMMDPSLYNQYGFNADFDYLVSYDQAWDSGLHFGCKCDIGYRGPDCSLVECPSDDDPLDDFCDDGRNGLGYVEFVGSEYYFSADTGALDPQEAPLPNKLLLFVEAYETSDLTNADNGCKITTNGHYKLTNPDQALGEVIRNSVHNQIDNAGARARSGVQDARFPGTNSAQARTQACIKALKDDSACNTALQTGGAFDTSKIVADPNLLGNTASSVSGKTCQVLCDEATLTSAQSNIGAVAQISKGASPGAANGIFKGAADLSGSTSDCVNGVFCGGRRFGEPCSGRGLCNYQDGTCQCHSGYAGNACQQVEEMA